MQPLYARSFPVIKPLVKQGGSKQKVRRGDAVRMMGSGKKSKRSRSPMRSKHIIRRT